VNQISGFHGRGNLYPDTGYPDYLFCGFASFLHANSGISAELKPLLYPTASLQTNNLLLTLGTGGTSEASVYLP